MEIVSSSVNVLNIDASAPSGTSLTLGCSIVGYCVTTGGNLSYTNYGFNVFFEGSSCLGGADVDGEWNMFPLWAPPGKFPARVPNSYSSALDAGHAFVCIPTDPWSQTRPLDNDGDGIAVVDIGAVEATLIFLDGFESGLGVWSGHTP